MTQPAHKKFNPGPYLALLTAIAIWGGALPIVKLTGDYISPFSFLFVRFLFVAIVMLPITILELKATPIHESDIKNLVLLGIFGQASIAFIFWGVKYTSAIDTAIISTIAPLLIITAGSYFYGEKLSSNTKLGVFIATIGTTLVVLDPILNGGTQTVASSARVFGNLLIIAYNIMFTLYVVFSKVVMGKTTLKIKKVLRLFHVNPMKREYSPVLHTSIEFYVGLLVLIPFAVLENVGVFGANEGISIDSLTWIPVLGILYMAIFSSIVAYTAYEWGLKNAEVSDSAIFGYLGPLFTMPFSFLLLGEIPSKYALLGSGIIALGVILAERYKKRSA